MTPRCFRRCFAFLLALTFIFSHSYGQTGEEKTPDVVTVPEVRNLPVKTGKQKLHLRRLKQAVGRFYISPPSWRPELVEGKVYLQTPRAGTRTRPGATVAVWTFHKADAKQKIVATPAVQGAGFSAAKKTLAGAGLGIMLVNVPTPPKGSQLTAGQVIDQYPRPRQKIYAGTTVLLHVFSPKK